MQWKETYANGSAHWEMGYQSYNQPETRSTFQVYHARPDVSCIWATEAEFYLTPQDDPSKLPQSYYYTWDLKATDRNGREIPLHWQPHIGDPAGMSIMCDVSLSNNCRNFKATELSYIPYYDSCPRGYSRAWNAQCAAECGCNNLDGTPKVTCDYCCMRSANGCQRSNGPTPATTTRQVVRGRAPPPRLQERPQLQVPALSKGGAAYTL
eukprot:TRINITY_DN299_c0_g1_i5.p2 TRINITY_DN299_c0_g1~~TRINITY_DN299_c0_g1_i5.p2  ORF type:complete len:209 (+),score=51.58 TRINITY_DN299_c0_g1_i5:310-936(+)